MDTLENKSLIRKQHDDVWSRGNLDLVDQLYAAGFVCHSAGRSAWHGPEGVKERIRVVRTAFPDWTETIEDILTEGDRVATRFTCTGTHQAVFSGVGPTGRRIRVTEFAIYRIDRGKIAEQWLFHDATELKRQLTSTE